MARAPKEVVPQPMLAGSISDRSEIIFPVYASEKYDGFRCIVRENLPRSRNEWKVLPNKDLQAMVAKHDLNDLDGELMLTEFKKNVFSETQSIVTAHEKPIGLVRFFVFDIFGDPRPYKERYEELLARFGTDHEFVTVVHHEWCENLEQLEAFEATLVDKPGYEGFMINDPFAGYLYGRSNGLWHPKPHGKRIRPKSVELMKVKPHKDTEAVIVGFKQLVSNKGEIRTDSWGRNYRHVDLDNKEASLIPQEMVGAFWAVFHNGKEEVKFKIGSGLTKDLREHAWQNPDLYIGAVVKFRFNDLAGQGRPRNPRFLAIRNPIDVLSADLLKFDEMFSRWKDVEVKDEE